MDVHEPVSEIVRQQIDEAEILRQAADADAVGDAATRHTASEELEIIDMQGPTAAHAPLDSASGSRSTSSSQSLQPHDSSSRVSIPAAFFTEDVLAELDPGMIPTFDMEYLLQACHRHGIPTMGRKHDLVERLSAYGRHLRSVRPRHH